MVKSNEQYYLGGTRSIQDVLQDINNFADELRSGKIGFVPVVQLPKHGLTPVAGEYLSLINQAFSNDRDLVKSIFHRDNICFAEIKDRTVPIRRGNLRLLAKDTATKAKLDQLNRKRSVEKTTEATSSSGAAESDVFDSVVVNADAITKAENAFQQRFAIRASEKQDKASSKSDISNTTRNTIRRKLDQIFKDIRKSIKDGVEELSESAEKQLDNIKQGKYESLEKMQLEMAWLKENFNDKHEKLKSELLATNERKAIENAFF